jgi:hypothetical protein
MTKVINNEIDNSVYFNIEAGENESIKDLNEKIDWLIYFRRAKCLETLNFMYERINARLEQEKCSTFRYVNFLLALDSREVEINAGKFVR